MRDVIENVKMALPLPFDFIGYLKKLPYLLSVESNLQLKNSILVIAAFFGSIYFSGFLIFFLSFKFNILDSLNSINVIIFFIFNAVSISMIFALVIYLITFKAKKNFIKLGALFIQGIKFFTIFNIVIAFLMAIGINQLVVNNINLFSNEVNANAYSMNVPIPLILIIVASFIFAIVWVLLKPTYKVIAYSYPHFYKWVTFVILLSALGLISFVNHNLYSCSIFPKQDIKNLIIADKFCKEISEIKMIQNKKCSNASVEKISEFRSSCENLILNN